MANDPSHVHATTVQVARQSAYGTHGGSEWHALQPTTIAGGLAALERAVHDTIDASNQYQAGSVVGLTADVPISQGLTYAAARIFLPAAMRTVWGGPRALVDTATRPTSATSAHFVVPTMASSLPQNTLIKVSGCAVAGNNGIKVVSSGGTTTQIPCSGLTAETFTAGQNVTIEVCGFQFASGDLTVTVSGSTITLGTTTKDLTELGLASGQHVWLGDAATAAYSYATAATGGPARLTAAPTANAMTVDSTFTTWASDSGSGKTIRLFFGQTARVVARDAAAYSEGYYTVEHLISSLGTGNAARYQYTTDAAVNTFTLASPAAALATLEVSLMGRDVESTDTRKANASTPTLAKLSTAYNTTQDISGRLKLSSDGTALTGYITSATITIENGAQANPAHGVLGSAVTSYGKVRVRVSLEAFLTEHALITAARNNYAVSANVWLRNGDGAIVLDIPEGRVSTDAIGFTAGRVVTISGTVEANTDTTWSTSLIASLIPGCPALIARA